MKLLGMLVSVGGVLSVWGLQVSTFTQDRTRFEVRRGYSCLFLRPNQAAELEACANDLMKKEALVRRTPKLSNPFLNNYFSEPPQELLDALQRMHTKKSSNHAGPLTWLRKKLRPCKVSDREQGGGSPLRP